MTTSRRPAAIRLKRISAGDYITHDERFRVTYGWGDNPCWVLVEFNERGDANVIDDFVRLRDARARILHMSEVER